MMIVSRKETIIEYDQRLLIRMVSQSLISKKEAELPILRSEKKSHTIYYSLIPVIRDTKT